MSNININDDEINRDEFLDTDQNERLQDVDNSDAAKFTEDAEEQAMLENRPPLSDDIPQYADASAANGKLPLTTQGTAEEMEGNMGGTTNLSLDQLKKQHHPEGE
jgi:hypothetical protein